MKQDKATQAKWDLYKKVAPGLEKYCNLTMDK